MDEFFKQHRVVLAPMAGVSDPAFRTVCLEQGADLTYTEMVSAKGLAYANAKTRTLLELAEGEARVAVQLFGHEPTGMAKEAAWIEEEMGERLAYLDINMGCPARKIASKGDGSALMKSPELAAAVITAVSKAVTVPTTVKFRRGFELGDDQAVSFARMAEDAGAAALAVHGRYAQQFYHGKADWDTISQVKQAVAIPVIGNGDVTSGFAALAMREQTGCDAVMIGRGAQGNPWIFADVRSALTHSLPPDPPTHAERIMMAKRHARLLSEQGERNIVRMRKHAMWYFSGLPHANAARREINACSSLDDFDRVFDALLDALKEDEFDARPL